MAIKFPEGDQNLPSRAVQVVTTIKRNVFTTTSSSFVEIPSLTCTITPNASTSKVLVFGSVCYGHNNDAPWLNCFRLKRDSVDTLMIADADGNRGRHSGGGQRSGHRDDTHWWPILFLDSPVTTSAITYRVMTRAESPRTVYINRGDETDGNQVISGRFCSSLTVMEIAQ